MVWFATLLIVLAILAAAFVFSRGRRETARACDAYAGLDAGGTTAWTLQADEELRDLNESARCDLIFAVSQLDDERSRALLVSALADPSDTVSLAAAHALVRSGHMGEVHAYARSADAARSKELLELLTLID